MNGVVCIILGGGRGRRLHPLTKERAKPAVPIAGKYRLIDIPVSNCLNSGLNRVFVLTQFNTASLHRHIMHTYKFDDFGRGFVEILAAEQTAERDDWYQGTADAVRQNLKHLHLAQAELCLILSGDHIYRMDFRRMIDFHRERDALITLGAIPVERDEAGRFGVLKTQSDCAITDFREKPDTEELLEEFAVEPGSLSVSGFDLGNRRHLASMGIYLFNTEALIGALADEGPDDFGAEIIPRAVQECAGKVYAFPFSDYWVDIGTVSSFFEANLDLTSPVPRFNLFDEEKPVWTHARYLPASKLNGCDAERVILGDGSIIDSSRLRGCVIGLRSVIRRGCDLENVLMMGADFFETPEHRSRHETEGLPPIGLGENVRIRRAIIDKNTRIGDGVVIENAAGVAERDGPDYWIRDGIVVVPRSCVIPAGTTI